MKGFFSILIATFISVLGALATWNFAQAYLAKREGETVPKATSVSTAEDAQAAEKAIDRIKYEWKLEERTNTVTGEKVSTATRFSEDIGSSVTFRCYGLSKKRFDILISFPSSIHWDSYKGEYYSEMKFRVDNGELSRIRLDRSAPSVGAPNIEEAENFEKEYSEYYMEKNRQIRAFKAIGKASAFAASVPNGTIYEQTISIDLSGVEEAIKPVLSLCGKDSI